MNKSILILAIGFLPNIGGLETHLKDLISELIKRDWKVVVLTYQPLHTPVLGSWIEKSNNLTIYRLPSFRGLFYKLLDTPSLEFLFLGPLLFLFTPFVIFRYPSIRVINAQGIIAGFAGAFWSKVFNKRYVISAQSVYSFPKSGLFTEISRLIFKSADKIIAISGQSSKSIQNLGIEGNKISLYTNWEDSNFFKPYQKSKAKDKIGLSDKFIVSFFGRLVEEKGIKVLLNAIRLSDKQITFAIYGEGPLLNNILEVSQGHENVYYMKTISPEMLSLHYSAADLVVMPSLHEEGFGRVAAGALLCSTPVIASNRGALPEVVNDKVGRIINPTAKELANTINLFFHNQVKLKKLALNARKYALAKFSSQNVEDIIKAY